MNRRAPSLDADRALIRAIEEHDARAAEAAHARGASLAAKDHRGTPALSMCVERGLSNLARELIDHARALGERAGLDDPDAQGAAPLAAMAAKGWDSGVSAMIRAGASLDCRDARGVPCISLAIDGSHLDCARLLIQAAKERGDAAALDAADSNGEGALARLAKLGMEGCLSALLEAGASLHGWDAAGAPCLSAALDAGQGACAALLLEAAISRGDRQAIDSFDRFGRGALARAQATQWSRLARLVEAGARLQGPAGLPSPEEQESFSRLAAMSEARRRQALGMAKPPARTDLAQGPPAPPASAKRQALG